MKKFNQSNILINYDENDDDNIIILKNEAIERYFLEEKINILGMDLYHKGLIEGFPIMVITFVTKKLKSIPLTISILENCEDTTISNHLKIIIDYYKLENILLMTDNSASQKSAFETNNQDFILCKYHLGEGLILFF